MAVGFEIAARTLRAIHHSHEMKRNTEPRGNVMTVGQNSVQHEAQTPTTRVLAEPH